MRNSSLLLSTQKTGNYPSIDGLQFCRRMNMLATCLSCHAEPLTRLRPLKITCRFAMPLFLSKTKVIGNSRRVGYHENQRQSYLEQLSVSYASIIADRRGSKETFQSSSPIQNPPVPSRKRQRLVLAGCNQAQKQPHSKQLPGSRASIISDRRGSEKETKPVSNTDTDSLEDWTGAKR